LKGRFSLLQGKFVHVLSVQLQRRLLRGLEPTGAAV
jgi:hypothetical protein